MKKIIFFFCCIPIIESFIHNCGYDDDDDYGFKHSQTMGYKFSIYKSFFLLYISKFVYELWIDIWIER